MNQQTIVSVLMVALSWVFSGLVTYGYMKAKITEFERRLLILEHSSEKFVGRTEYENRHADIVRQLDRIEAMLRARQ